MQASFKLWKPAPPVSGVLIWEPGTFHSTICCPETRRITYTYELSRDLSDLAPRVKKHKRFTRHTETSYTGATA